MYAVVLRREVVLSGVVLGREGVLRSGLREGSGLKEGGIW